ncbi:hypothetical protein EI42_06396, partial [Thermosporothrix hazakensis]
SCASGGAMPKERAERLLALLNELTKATSPLNEVAIPIRPHLSRAEPKKRWSTLVRVDLDGETREPHDLNELISWLKQFTRRKRIGQMSITMSCERSPVEVEMDVEKETEDAATE